MMLSDETRIALGFLLKAGYARIRRTEGRDAADESTYFDKVWAMRDQMQNARTIKRKERQYRLRPIYTFGKGS
jgi:hypothetical protein